MICPYFGYERVLVLVVFDGHRQAHVLLDGVFDLVELLPHVVGGVVLGARGGRPVVVALFPPMTHAPQQDGDQHQDPDHNEDRAEEGHKVVGLARARHPYFGDGGDDGAVAVAFADQVQDPLDDLFARAAVQAMVVGRNGDMDFVAG